MPISAIRAVATAPGPALVHCVGGKDRTGLVVALLLRLAGVSRADIDADYAVSESNLDDQHWIDEAPDEVEAERRRKIVRSPAGVMAAVLEELERRHGGAWSYLEASGVHAEDLQRVRARLRP